jgi:hypothetical protein
MDIVNRIKNILTHPKTEWAAIDREKTPHASIFASYLLPLALIPAIACFIGYGLIGYTSFGVHFSSISWGIRQAAVQFIAMTGGVYITALVIYLLAEGFGSVKNFDKTFALVVYSYTPMCLAGVLYLIPSVSWLASIAGLYGLYLLYTGLQPLMKTPEDKTLVYFIVSLICTVVVSVVLSAILAVVLLRGWYY